ncbi:LysR family transcriptional regulator ArgP [Paracoccus nototheniae]|uniref:LysR family transcriptional regulator ArgP n=1 Tax=Paracoccus nototheniae TaxID=2489002 RepID=A0ABW4DQV7_9RHOB|nr:LysR family transcriptional regulator ArgP [Paracoccus nototheniae]
MLDYAAARAVATIVRLGSFDRAARALNVTPSAISQRVRLLEERLGTVLIERGSPCTATPSGAWLCRHMEQVDMLEAGLSRHLPGLSGGDTTAPRVTIELAVNADSLGTWFLPALARFADRSGFLLNLSVDDEGHTADWLRRGRVLAAVTGLGQPVQGCDVMALGALRYVPTASPAFMARHFPDGVTATALAAAPALSFDRKDLLQQSWAEAQFGPQATGFPCHRLPSTQGFVTACLAGMGWALNPASLVRDHLAAGRLVPLIADATQDVPLFWQINRMALQRLQGLTRAVRQAARDALQPPAGTLA